MRRFIPAATLVPLLATAGCGPLPEVTPELLEGTFYDVTPDAVRPVDDDAYSLVIVADTSGSMDGEKMEAMKETLHKTVAMLGSYAGSGKRLEVGLVTFDGSNDGHPPQYQVPVSPFNFAQLSEAVSGLTAGGGTPLGSALALASQGLNQHGTGRSGILLATDGENTAGRNPFEIYRAMQTASSAGLAPHTSLYVVAFQTPVEYFQNLAGLGASVRGASNATELTDLMLGNVQMMLEAPDPAPPRF